MVFVSLKIDDYFHSICLEIELIAIYNSFQCYMPCSNLVEMCNSLWCVTCNFSLTG